MIRKTIILLLVLFSNKNFATDFVLSAPPTETREVSVALYEPIAQYISDVFDIDVAYEYPDNWPVYIRNMQKARYDFLVDAPHFVSWRVEKIEHNPLVSLSDELQYIVAVPDKSTVQGIMDLKGKSACASSIPNLDTLTLLDQFDSSWTQPSITYVQGFREKYARLLDGACDAAILPRRVYDRLENGQSVSRILFESQVLPHLGLTASPRVGRALQESIRQGLLLPDAAHLFAPLNELYALDYGNGAGPVRADADEYRGYSYLLEEFWGF